MKKKAIERIEYLGLPKTSRKGNVRFVCRTAIKNVAHERHLFIEVYKNSKESREEPLVRIAFTKKDFGNYFPAEGIWTRAKIEGEGWSTTPLIWDQRVSTNRKEKAEQNILYSDADFERIKSFFKDADKQYIDKQFGKMWWSYIQSKETTIRSEEKSRARTRKYERRQQALKDRLANTPELPEQEILSWAGETLFKNRHYLYYRKKGPRATICCSECGGVAEGRWKVKDTYEGQHEKYIPEPRDKSIGTCPLCGARGTYKQQGKAKGSYEELTHVYKADKYKETGVVIRYIELTKGYQLIEDAEANGEQYMVGAREILSGMEIARVYINDGKIQTDYHKHDWCKGEDFWDDCNLYGLSNITLTEAPLYPGFADSLKGTCLQYSAIELYAAEIGNVNARNYLERYLYTPQIEMLVKMRLYGVVRELCQYHYGIVSDENAHRPDKFLGIRKEKVKQLIACKGNLDLLKVLQMENRMEQNWTEEQTLALAELQTAQTNIERVCRIMTLQKALNLIAKYAGCEYGTNCSHAIGVLRETARTYFDYLYMREQNGYDMSNTVYQRPRNLAQAHMKMVEEQNKEEYDKIKKTVEEKFPLIRKNYRKLRTIFMYEDDDFIIRPARSATEIVQEGRILHHCVGGDNYLRNHNEQTSIILMLRKKESPELPYITAEFHVRHRRIIQWQGTHNRQPDRNRMQKWLNAYETRLKCEKNAQDAAEKARDESLAAGA
ncbi:MAG: PcfJ domain-containing protein [Butyrivibrio sp.]|nr:PcfJ domain-containing protein [Acetatifactor muris]MCM1560944.1 PcfJ domain-containing protein [Butyrivibrio sp.]